MVPPSLLRLHGCAPQRRACADMVWHACFAGGQNIPAHSLSLSGAAHEPPSILSARSTRCRAAVEGRGEGGDGGRWSARRRCRRDADERRWPTKTRVTPGRPILLLDLFCARICQESVGQSKPKMDDFSHINREVDRQAHKNGLTAVPSLLRIWSNMLSRDVFAGGRSSPRWSNRYDFAVGGPFLACDS